LSFHLSGIKLRPSLVCLWRLLAHILNAVGSYPQTRAYLIVSGELVAEDVETKVIQGDKLFELAARCYSRAIRLSKEDSYLWHELAITYYQRTLRYPKATDVDREALRLAGEAAKYSIKMLPTRWQNWNLLGVISTHRDAENLPLAQHCFIKAVTLDKTSAVAWTNLGVLYMLQSQVKLANKAFGRAQQSDTNFAEAWVGQALIAEQIGQNEESIDLFRHCTQLDWHVESSIGYPHWVCSILNEPDYRSDPKHVYAIDHMYAVPVALDAVTWHCDGEDTEASLEAWCFLGALNAKQNLWIGAVKAYQRALAKAEGATKDKILCDLGYSLLKLKKPLEAIQAFNSVTEATFKATVGLALAHFRAQQFQESYSVYESVLQWLASTDTEKSLVLVAMSAMVYAFQGEGDAKTVLFQW
jgi:superkiller protein 3